jgi:hypothetical protein
MLEQVHLLIQHAQGETAWTIADADTHRPLGVARWRPWTGRPWLSWLSQPILDVFETDDEPLVFSVRRLWALSSKWEVRDADGHRVALLRHGLIVDALDQFRARVERSADDSLMQFQGPTLELAHATWSVEGVRIEFAPQIESEPLIKMALLAAVLIA